MTTASSPVAGEKTIHSSGRPRWGDWKGWTQFVTARIARGLDLCLPAIAPPSVGILVYHRVAAAPNGVATPSWNVQPAAFRQQLTELLEGGFQPMSLRDLQNTRTADALGRPGFVVTFDDGFQSVYTGAFPTLAELKVPATVFVNTAFLDQADPFPFDDWGHEHRESVPSSAWLPLSISQCEEMAESGLIEFGSHTHTHADFRGRLSNFESDVETSLEHLRRWNDGEHAPFAFPFGRPHLGYASPEMMSVVERLGCSCALTTEAVPVTPGTSPFGWGRFNAYETDTGATLAAKCNGRYSWAPKFQERLYAARQSRKPLASAAAVEAAS